MAPPLDLSDSRAPSHRRAAAAGIGWLVLVGLVLPFGLAFVLGFTSLDASLTEYVLASLMILLGASAGGAGFVRAVARMAGVSGVAGVAGGADRTGLAGPRMFRRLAWAGALGFGPAAITAGVLLGVGEPVALRAAATWGIPIHILFPVLFVPATFAVIAVLGLAVGRALRSRRLAVALAWKAGLAAAAAFLVANVVQDLLGRRVGAPDAAATATMITVTLLGLIAAAAATGAVMAAALERHAAAVRPDRLPATVGLAPVASSRPRAPSAQGS